MSDADSEIDIESLDRRGLEKEWHAAARRGNLPMLKSLLGKVDPQCVDADGQTALVHAAHKNQVEAVRFLLPLVDPRRADNEGATALLLAAYNGSPECVSMLLPLSDAKAADSEGMTPLMWAACSSSAECVNLLIPASDPNALDNENRTALMMAAWTGELANVRALLPVSDVSLRDEGGETPFMRAAQSSRGQEKALACMQELLAVSDLRATDNTGRQALDFAALADNTACVEYFADFLTDEEAAVLVARVGAEKMPRWMAKKEAEALSGVVAGAQPEGFSAQPRRMPRAL